MPRPEAGTGRGGRARFKGSRGMPLVTGELVRRGLSEADIVKIVGGHVPRLFRAELGRPR